jgi:hypothetical protein
MKPLSNFNFETITTSSQAIKEIEHQLKILTKMVSTHDFPLSEDDKKQLVDNIKWLKRFYEAAERTLLDETRRS